MIPGGMREGTTRTQWYIPRRLSKLRTVVYHLRAAVEKEEQEMKRREDQEDDGGGSKYVIAVVAEKEKEKDENKTVRDEGYYAKEEELISLARSSEKAVRSMRRYHHEHAREAMAWRLSACRDVSPYSPPPPPSSSLSSSSFTPESFRQRNRLRPPLRGLGPAASDLFNDISRLKDLQRDLQVIREGLER